MSHTIAGQLRSTLTFLVRHSRWRPQGDTMTVGAVASEEGRCDGSERRGSQEPEAVARGAIRREQVTLLARYGTSYGLFDAGIDDYQCVLKSDTYELGAYVGDSVRVSGALCDVIGGMPVMNVTRLELSKLKWMR